MKKVLFAIVFIAAILSAYAAGQQEDATQTDAYADYMSWTKVNQETITGDVTGALGPAHQSAKGFREIFVNDIGRPTAYGETAYPYPAGSIILKESYKAKDGDKGALDGFTIMIKRENGYDADNGNWEYVMTNTDFKVSQQGKIGMCIGCHSAGSDKDFTFWDSSM